MTAEEIYNEMRKKSGFFPCASEPEVGILLASLIRITSAKRALELGTHVGAISAFMAEALEYNIGHLYCVDIDMRIDEAVLTRFGNNISARRRDSQIAVKEFQGQGLKFDLIFIDDWHGCEHIKNLFNTIPDISNEHCLWVFHDVNMEEVKRGIDHVAATLPVQRLELPTPRMDDRNPDYISGVSILRYMKEQA